MTLTFNGRLPSVLCETTIAASPSNPLRLDVAGFVGFAERGPLNLPVMVEDISQYHQIFGADVVVARDGGRPIYANLPTAVNSFFNNGGRRAYVVRVARESKVDPLAARPNRFMLPGLIYWNWKDRTIQPVVLPAAWVGSWSDGMQVGTQLRRDPLQFDNLSLSTDGKKILVDLMLPTIDTVQEGDLLRLKFDNKTVLIMPVETVERKRKDNENNSDERTALYIPFTVAASRKKVLGFDYSIQLQEPTRVERLAPNEWQELPVPLDIEGDKPDNALSFAEDVEVMVDDMLRLTFADDSVAYFPVSNVEWAHIVLVNSSLYDIQIEQPTKVERLGLDEWQALRNPLDIQDENLDNALPFAENVDVKADDILRLTFADDSVVYFPVDDVQSVLTADNETIRWAISAVPFNIPIEQPSKVERLEPQEWQKLPRPHRIRGNTTGNPLAFLEDVDVQVNDFLQLTFDDDTVTYYQVSDVEWTHSIEDNTLRWAFSSEPFSISDFDALSGSLQQVDLLTFDLTVRDSQHTIETWRLLRFGKERDHWQSILMNVDYDKQSVSVNDFTGSLNLGVPPSPPNLDEPPHITLPFAMSELGSFVGPLHDDIEAGKDGLDSFEPETLFLDDQLANVGYRSLLNQANQWSVYNRKRRPIQKLHRLIPIDEIGLISVPDAVHRLWKFTGTDSSDEEPDSTDGDKDKIDERDWSEFQVQDCIIKAEPTDNGQNGDEAKKEPPKWLNLNGTESSDTRPLSTYPEVQAPDKYKVAKLLTVHRAMINIAATRNDMVAILSLPLHMKMHNIQEWHRQLVNTQDFFDGVPLSYAAAYHGWVSLRESVSPMLAPLRHVPPDGTVCGMIAARELERGAWIAPANVPLQEVTALRPNFSDSEWQPLYDRQINVLRQQPGRFALMSAFTLSQDRLFQQLSVRRFLIYLRKLALRQGQRYVFETNNQRFRQLLQGHFERILTQLMNLGALQAFQIDTGSAVNTQNDMDNGRFIIAIKVAPTNPIEFITITMLRSGESVLEVLVR